jgi:hypothetical protein
MSSTSGSLLRAVALLMLLLASNAAVLFAQTTADTGSIVGTVRDPSGASDGQEQPAAPGTRHSLLVALFGEDPLRLSVYDGPEGCPY